MNAPDLTGQRFGALVVERLHGVRGRGYLAVRLWRCRCDCGEIATVTTGNLRSGNSKACMFWRNHGGDRAVRTAQTRRSRKVA